jgi:hypothetical protein
MKSKIILEIDFDESYPENFKNDFPAKVAEKARVEIKAIRDGLERNATRLGLEGMSFTLITSSEN